MANKPYYVRNGELLPHIFEYRETGIVSEELGRLILKIASNYANKGSFYGYTWKEDMVGEAVLTVCKYLHNFDPFKQKRPNPFAYITSIVHNAFLGYIKKQKKHSVIKDVLYKNAHLIEGEEFFYSQKAINYEGLKKNGTTN